MSRINPLRRLYDDLTEKLSKDEVRRLRDLLSEDQITTREKEDLKTPTDIFTKLEKSGHISETDLKLLKDLLEAIGRRPLVSEVERVEKELQVWRMERFSDESKVKSTEMQSSVGGDVTASSAISSAAVHREMVSTMKDPEGEPTSLQQHTDNHGLRHVQYITTTNVQAKPQLQGQEQADVTTGSIPSKRRKGSAQSTCITESKYPDAVVSCEKYLKSLYVKLSEILPFPWWDGTNRLKLENVYIELELQTKKGEKRDFSRREIFSPRKDEESQTTPKRVLIEGDPGYGKTTFCKKLIYDWAKGGIEYLNRFKVMFHFELRDLLDSDAQNIQDAVFNQLLKNVRDESERSELWNFVQSNQEKVCFVFDGLDEVPTKDLPPYFKEMIAVNCSLPDCPVIVTSRKIRDINSKQMYDTILSIKGFDYEKAKSFIEKHMNEMNSHGKEVKASDFLQELEKSNHKDVLIDFMQSPLNTLMLCDIWIHSIKLPNTRTKLYEEIVDYVVKRYRENHNCTSHVREEINQALLLIGQMSYRGLTTLERKVYFSEEDISQNRYIRELGLLTKVSEFPAKYGFYHLTFQEYFASVYVARLLAVDSCKFIDAITLLSQERGFNYNYSPYAFLGGKLQNNVDEIFKAMQEKGIFRDEYFCFDPRPILYESCCTSTTVIEHCAEFLPKHLIVDLNPTFGHSDSNRLTVNTTLLQCPRTRSKEITLKLSVVNADTVAMYRKCYEAVQKNEKQIDSIYVMITIDLNDCQGKSRGFVENLTFINNDEHHSLLDPLHINGITVEICNRVKSRVTLANCHLTTILKSLSLVPADSLTVCGLPLGNLELIRVLIDSLSRNKIRGCSYIKFGVGYADFMSRYLLKISANFGNFFIFFNMNTCKTFKLVDLHKLLSTFASVYSEKLLLHVSIHHSFNLNTTSDVTDVLHSLGSVDIEQFSLAIEGCRDSNKKDICHSISAIAEATSRVSAQEFNIQGLPPGNVDIMREMLTNLNNNKLIRSISIIFGKRPIGHPINTINITTHFGKFNIDYNCNTVEFNSVGLQNLLSTCTAIENVRLSLNVVINSGVHLTKKTESDIANILRHLQFADLEMLELKTKYYMHLDLQNESPQEFWLSRKDMRAHILTIVEEVSRVSAKRLYIQALPLENGEFMKNVLRCLRNSQRLGFVSLTFYENVFVNSPLYRYALQMNVNFEIFYVRYEMNRMDFKLADLSELFPTSVAGDDSVSPYVSLTLDVNNEIKLDIAEVLSKLESVEIRRLILRTRIISNSDLKREELYIHCSAMVKALSRVSANMLVIEGLPIGKLEFMGNLVGFLSSFKLLKTVYMKFCDDDNLQPSDTGKIEIYAMCGKFLLLWKMKNMDFNLVGLRQSLTQCLSLDNSGVTFAVRVNYNLNESTNTEVTEIIKKLGSVNIEKMSLDMSYDTNISIEDIYSRISDMLQSLSLINANSFVIKGLPCEDIKFIKFVCTTLERSFPDKVTYISFGPSHCPICGLHAIVHTTVTAKNQKHIREFYICKSKLDIVSLYQELQERLSTLEQKFLIDAQIQYTLNIKDDIQYILDGSKSIAFNKIEYVDRNDNLSQTIDMLEKLAELNTEQFSYKSSKFLGYKSTKSVVDAMLQCQSAQTVVISFEQLLVEQYDVIKIPENIEQLVSDGFIIHGVKLSGRKLVIQGTYAEEANTLSKVIEVEFTLSHKLVIDWSDDDLVVIHAILGYNNALTNMSYDINVFIDMFVFSNAIINICREKFYGLQTISELDSLCIELPVILSTPFQTFYPCKFTMENILDCVLALRYLTKVTIVGGKIISTDNSSEKWIDLCSTESLQMLTFKGCDLNSSCQTVIDSFNKADERRCSQLRITLSDSLCLQNMNTMKDMLLSESFDLNDKCWSVSQGDTVFCLKGKSVSVFASLCTKQEATYKPLLMQV